MKILGYTVVKNEEYHTLVQQSNCWYTITDECFDLKRRLSAETLALRAAQIEITNAVTAYKSYRDSINEDKIAFKERLLELLIPIMIPDITLDELIITVDKLSNGVYNG